MHGVHDVFLVQITYNSSNKLRLKSENAQCCNSMRVEMLINMTNKITDNR